MSKLFPHTSPGSILALAIAWYTLSIAGCSVLRSEFWDPPESQYVDEGQLKLQGYYAREWISHGANVLSTLMLWEDGTAAAFVVGGNPCGRDEAKHEDHSFQAQHRRFRENLRCITGERNRRNPAWGVFAVVGDSIEIHVITHLNYGGSGEHRPLVDKGVILSDSTFKITSSILRGSGPPRDRDETFQFFPLEEKPPSTNWTQTHPDLQ
ncbi:MAG: hypothetical protein ABJF88_04085 [Rhodothermales bacterium]